LHIEKSGHFTVDVLLKSLFVRAVDDVIAIVQWGTGEKTA
jgi:hypothetical protein